MRAHSTLANVHLRARQPGSATARCAIASRRARQPVGRGFLRFRDCSEGTSQPRVAFLARPQQALAKMAALANDGPYSTEVREAVRAVRMASRLCIAVQQQMRSADREDKADDSPVTVADYGAQAVVAWALTRAFPEARLSLVAEEDAADLRKPDGAAMRERITTLVNSVTNAALSENDVMDLIDLGGSAGGSHGTHWVLDPIDGTRGFVGMRQYAIALGMIDVRIPAASLEGEVVLGVLGCPNLPEQGISQQDGGSDAAARAGVVGIGSVFAAVQGRGCYVGPIGGDAMPDVQCTVEDRQDPREATYMESFESRHSSHSRSSRVAELVGLTPESLRLDSQAKYGVLARDDAQVFMRFPPDSYREKIWDHVAGVAVVQEAGAVVTDGTGSKLDFGRGRYLEQSRGIVAAPPALHRAIISAVAKVVEEESASQ